ncbi:MAG: DUF4321 domain-containing protein [Ruminococcus sp.]|nr:DUF4321 domain-containing protein [Ruminococcus sp.]
MKRTIYMIFLIGCASIAGNLLGNTVIGTEGLNWLSYSKKFGFDPGTFDFFDVFNITFGFHFAVNIAQLILIIAAIIIYTKTAPKIFTK